MKPSDVVNTLLAKQQRQATQSAGEAFAPSNIALCKYWGKRNTELNLPMNSSLSISLGEYGSRARIEYIEKDEDEIIINGDILDSKTSHAKRTSDFLDLFRENKQTHYQLKLDVNIPLAAGLASSACIYASIVKSLCDFYRWDLDSQSLSILARLGSGSASRSLSHGFVEWHRGSSEDGLDSFAEALDVCWPDFQIGLVIISREPKAMSSRQGMQHTVETSQRYQSWPLEAEEALRELKSAIAEKHFQRLGETAENNARAMHATMLGANPPLSYSTAETRKITDRVWELRKAGLPVYFTQDAGPNIKLLFLGENQSDVEEAFPGLKVITPFQSLEA